ncbi:MAG: S41 family peptidase [Clostridia bacterium]|nr:S41 family peptidase [Clostridia bacterium]
MSDIDKLSFIIQTSYAGEVDSAKLTEGAAEGMMNVLGDPHSVYMTEEEYQAFIEDMEAFYTGIGVEVSMQENDMVVISVFEESPASKAGICPGDTIKRVDDIAVSAETYKEAVRAMRDKEKKEVTIALVHEGETKTVTVTPDTINIETVSTKQYGDIFYISIRGFDSPTEGEMAHAIEKAKQCECTHMVLDLRDNPGGLLRSAAAIADMFLPTCDIVHIEDKNGKQHDNYQSDADCITMPLVVLVNEDSASASEVLAATLRDNQRAVLVGAKTYGKGSVQTIIKLKEGAAKLTIAHYFTPGGYVIDGNGIEPDYPVAQGEEDTQLQKALEIVKTITNPIQK